MIDLRKIDRIHQKSVLPDSVTETGKLLALTGTQNILQFAFFLSLDADDFQFVIRNVNCCWYSPDLRYIVV